MKTIYDAESIQKVDANISSLSKAIVMQKVAKKQLIDNYVKQSNLIAEQLMNLLSINDGYELSVLFNLPQTKNSNALKCWVIDYLVKYKRDEMLQYKLSEVADSLKSEIAIRQQDFYI